MRTQRDIQRDQAENKLREAIIEIYSIFREINIMDMQIILSSQLNKEIHAMSRHYVLTEKET